MLSGFGITSGSMAYIFLDESGDLGFKEVSSQWFLFTIAITSNRRSLERVIKHARRKLLKKHKNVSELHAYHADKMTRRRVLEELANIDDLKVLCTVLNKKKVYVDLQSQKNHLYNYTANILLDRLHSRKIFDLGEPIYLCVDRKDTNKNIRKNFEQYIETSLREKKYGVVSMESKASYDDKSLQAVDFLSWAIFRKYERGDYEYYEMIKGKIIEENLLFP